MAINADEDTEFNDALRKHGILPPKPAAPASPSPPLKPTLEEELDDLDPSILKDLADEAEDSETERLIRSYERRRLAELEEERLGKFGDIKPIGREDYTREITEASAVDDEGEGSGTGVVCFLYQDGHPASVALQEQLVVLARRHPRTKFVSIVGDKCIPNYPDKNLPTLLMYRKGEMTNQVVAWGASQRRSIEDLEELLISSRVLKPISKRPPKPREDEEDEEEAEFPVKRSIRGPLRAMKPKIDDDDSDFDL